MERRQIDQWHAVDGRIVDNIDLHFELHWSERFCVTVDDDHCQPSSTSDCPIGCADNDPKRREFHIVMERQQCDGLYCIRSMERQ